MDTNQIIALLAVVATLVGAAIAAGAQIYSTSRRKRLRKMSDDDIDESGRWKHVVDPKTSSLEERIMAVHFEASMVNGATTKLKVIQEDDLDAKQ